MHFYSDNKFVVKWVNKDIFATALITFNVDNNWMKIESISPLTDPSYDFKDLNFIKLNK